MQINTPIWLNPTTGGYVYMHHDIWQKIIDFMRHDSSRFEAGGILIGSYRGPHIEIVDATQPMPSDKRSRHNFLRCDPGHRHIVQSSWESSNHTNTFIGEWHTHPEKKPVPSSIDKNSWNCLIKANQTYMFFLIFGYSDHWAGIMHEHEGHSALRKVIKLFR